MGHADGTRTRWDLGNVDGYTIIIDLSMPFGCRLCFYFLFLDLCFSNVYNSMSVRWFALWEELLPPRTYQTLLMFSLRIPGVVHHPILQIL